jgi:UDP-N-acetylglucosamine:LPS N-acetylglucosamine transferase
MAIILALGAILGIYLFFKEFRKRQLQERLFTVFTALKPHEEKLRKAIAIFDQYISSGRYFTNKQYRNWKEEFGEFSNCISFPIENFRTEDAFKEVLIKFSNYYKNGRAIIDR